MLVLHTCCCSCATYPPFFPLGERFEVSSIAARVAVGAFAFMALIVSSTYTANLAAFLTVQQVCVMYCVYVCDACVPCVCDICAMCMLYVSSPHPPTHPHPPTNTQINSAITSAADLKGKAVASTAIYLPRLRVRWGIVATDEKVQGDDTLRTVAQGVVNGEFAAFIWYVGSVCVNDACHSV